MAADHSPVAAHTQEQTIHLHRSYEGHLRRADDPNYHLFEETKARLKKLGQWKCVIGTDECDGPISLHHSHFEFAYANGQMIDVDRVNAMLGLHLTDDEFQKWIEEPGNLEPLCFAHHMGTVAIHEVPAADWDTVRAHKTGLRPIEVVRAAHPVPRPQAA